MLLSVLVLLATSSFVSGQVNPSPINNQDGAKAGSVVERAFKEFYIKDLNIFIIESERVINDMANIPDDNAKAQALGQTIAILGEFSTDRTSDSSTSDNAARRLYNSPDIRSKNLAAQLTATSLPITVQFFKQSLTALINLADSVGSNRNLVQAGDALKEAFINALPPNNQNPNIDNLMNQFKKSLFPA